MVQSVIILLENDYLKTRIDLVSKKLDEGYPSY